MHKIIAVIISFLIGVLIGYYFSTRENYMNIPKPGSEAVPDTSPDGSGRCGSVNFEKLCPKGQCCSLQGYCGVTQNHCCENNSPRYNGANIPICNKQTFKIFGVFGGGSILRR